MDSPAQGLAAPDVVLGYGQRASWNKTCRLLQLQLFQVRQPGKRKFAFFTLMSGRKRKADAVDAAVADGPPQKAAAHEEIVDDEDEEVILYDSGLVDGYYIIIKGVPTSDYPGLVENYVGQVLCGKTQAEVGTLEAYEVTRYLSSPYFYEWCDSIHQEIQECSTLFFNEKGGIEKKYASKFSAAANSDEPYVHITKICIDEGHRGKDLGVRLLKALLDQLDGTWSIAMMQPYPLDGKGASFRQGIEKLTRYFARLGFKQCGTNPSSEDIKFSALQCADYTGVILDKAAVQTLPVVLPLQDVPVTDATKEITKLIETTMVPGGRDPFGLMYQAPLGQPAFDPKVFEAKVRKIQARGGDVNQACALHYAIANEKDALIDPLLKCGASVHHADKHGSTALHVAAACSHARAVTILLQHGADKKLRDAENRNAVQMARQGIKDKMKLYKTLGLPFHDVDGEMCVQLLK